MVGSNESMTSDTLELQERQASVIYLEEDEEIPIEHGGAYFIDEVGGGVFLVDNDWDGEQSGEDEQWDEPCTEIPRFGDRVPRFRIDSEEDIKGMDLKAFSPHEIEMYDFGSMELAYKFYSSYAMRNGFCVRKSSIVRSKKTREPYQQEYVCNRAGFRRDNGKSVEDMKREPRVNFRCGCSALFRVHIDFVTSRWYCTWFDDDHNHDLLDPIHCGMLPAHRKMSASEIMQMNEMMKVGISPSHIYRSFALQAGGYQKIGFRKKDLYNQIHRQMREQCSDAVEALKYLKDIGGKDGKPGFTAELKKCMLGDYDLDEFSQAWDEMVSKYHLEDNHWVNALYEKRSMWATAHIWEHIRFKEKEDDFASLHGDSVLQTKYPSIEKSVAKYLTKELFMKCRYFINKAADFVVVGCSKTLTVSIFTVCKRGGRGKEWKVTHDAGNNEFKCDCMRMESRGLPCEHLVAVLVHLRINDLPRCFVLKWWSKGAKDGFYDRNGDGDTTWNSSLVFRSDEAMHVCRLIIKLNDTAEEHHEFMDKLLQIYEECKARKSCLHGDGSSSSRFVVENLRDPVCVRTKGRGGGKSTTFGLAVRRRKKCSICKVPGHNKLTCPHSQRQAPLHESEDDDIYFPTQDLDTDMIPGHNQHTCPHSQREAPLHESEDDDIYFPTQDLDTDMIPGHNQHTCPHSQREAPLHESEDDDIYFPTQDLDTDMIPGHNQHTCPHSQREAPLHESEDDDIYLPTQDLDTDMIGSHMSM
ncbi:Zinc finger, PMZ-type [Sesbania bispinosa]|nr:Zinc finger, PMZ-type [Sesbania bispinosa]